MTDGDRERSAHPWQDHEICEHPPSPATALAIKGRSSKSKLTRIGPARRTCSRASLACRDNFCVHQPQQLFYVVNPEALGHQVGAIDLPHDLLQGELALAHDLLQPQVAHLEVADLAQTLARGDGLGSGRVDEEPQA